MPARRTRFAAIAVLATTALSACTSSGGGTSPSAPGSGAPAGFCTKLQDAAGKLSSLRSAASNPNALNKYFDEITSAFAEVEKSAPPQVSSAVNDLMNTIKASEKSMNGDPQQALRQLTQVAGKLRRNGTAIQAYIRQHCSSSG